MAVSISCAALFFALATALSYANCKSTSAAWKATRANLSGETCHACLLFLFTLPSRSSSATTARTCPGPPGSRREKRGRRRGAWGSCRFGASSCTANIGMGPCTREVAKEKVVHKQNNGTENPRKAMPSAQRHEYKLLFSSLHPGRRSSATTQFYLLRTDFLKGHTRRDFSPQPLKCSIEA